MPQDYVLVVNGKREGPFTIEELKARRIKPGDFVRTDTMDDYKEAHEVAELRALFGFALRPVTPQYFGSFDQRVMATLIDWLLVSAVFMLPAVIGMLIMHDAMIRVVLLGLVFVLVPLAKFIYSIIMEGGAKHATYGKSILHIKVCLDDGSDIDYAKAAARNLTKIFSTAAFFVPYLLCFFTKKQQCLHDMIAGTLVIKDRLV